VEQQTHNILVSPLDFNGIHVFHKMRHEVVIITTTADRKHTTVSINGDAPQTLNHPMYWIENQIGGSEFSFARYPLGETEPGEQLNTTYRFDNPNGVLVLAYGQGTYTTYYYCAGYGGFDLALDFFVNDIHHKDIYGEAFCDEDYTFKAETNLTPSEDVDYPKWFFNVNTEDEIEGRGNFKWFKKLPPGNYKVRLEIKDDSEEIHIRHTMFDVRDLPKVAEIEIPELCEGEILDLDTPFIDYCNGPPEAEGWQIEIATGTNDYTPLEMPYTVSIADNGKRIRYWAINECGKGYGKGVLTVKACCQNKPEIRIVYKGIKRN
jgi:hypothetical protein